MKLRNIRIILLIILVGIGFSSCDKWDYYWTDARLRSELEVKSDAKGIFDTYYTLDINRNVVDSRDNNFYEVRDLKYFTGDIQLIADDAFYNAKLQLLYRDRVISEYYFGNGRAGKHTYAGYEVEQFQADVVEYLRRDGRAELLFIGDSDFRNSFMNVSILMDIDAYVRD